MTQLLLGRRCWQLVAQLLLQAAVLPAAAASWLPCSRTPCCCRAGDSAAAPQDVSTILWVGFAHSRAGFASDARVAGARSRLSLWRLAAGRLALFHGLVFNVVELWHVHSCCRRLDPSHTGRLRAAASRKKSRTSHSKSVLQASWVVRYTCELACEHSGGTPTTLNQPQRHALASGASSAARGRRRSRSRRPGGRGRGRLKAAAAAGPAGPHGDAHLAEGAHPAWHVWPRCSSTPSTAPPLPPSHTSWRRLLPPARAQVGVSINFTLWRQLDKPLRINR